MTALVQGMPVIVEEKHPWAVKRIINDWTSFADDASIVASTWIDADVTAGLTVAAGATDGLKTMTQISDGTDGKTGYVENRVEFSDGRKEVMTVILHINTKVPS
jgi:hypothetical protein